MKIKRPDRKKSGHIPPPTEPINYDQKPPIFSLEKLALGKYCLSGLDQEHKAKFADAVFRRKNLPWIDIKNADKHALGTEKIARKSIKAPMPKFITEDVDHFIALRFHGMKPMVGYRTRDIFYVLWFDSDFTLYNH
ncbi:hypothetical protein [Candidatus Nitrotoga arctica]|uniref:Uncharacterized protein n=1 Tax=Candidatus Nitrotoga arctica TaxID=453162 RepID=A0ABM8YXH0_9PROT|nr:hypothetical protein [Candidatus Nitrotoga arctica]CAG9932194.1 conserved protein of unknown function [Candidatus Nitrotoga arctica]